jgi:hypothetical protein
LGLSVFSRVANIGSSARRTFVAPMRIEMGVTTVPWLSPGSSPLPPNSPQNL